MLSVQSTLMLTMVSDIWYLTVTLLCVAWITWIFISNKRQINPPLPPGPRGLPILGNLPFLQPELHSYFADLAKVYGPIMTLRLGKETAIVVSSPSLAKEELKDFDLTFANRALVAAATEATYGLSDIAWASYGPEWRMLRKVCVHDLLSSSALEDMKNLRKHEIDQTMCYKREQEGCAVNIGDQMFLTAMNVVTSMLWGGTIKGEERERVGADFRAVVSEITELVMTPNVSDFFPALASFDLQGVVRKTRVCARTMDNIFEEVIAQHIKMDNSREKAGKDFLQVLLNLKESGNSKAQLTIVQLKAVLIDMVIAGTDTTSNTVDFAMAEMMKRPEVMRRAQEELDSVVVVGNPVEESHLHQLPYLRAIMRETLRLHSVAPLLLPHRPSQSHIVGDYTIPKGSRVFVNVWAIHRNPSVWEDPLKFKPERFMNVEHDVSGHGFTYLPFGSGRRICVGVELGERIVMLSLASLLHYFNWMLPEGLGKVEILEKFGLVLKLRTPLLLIPSPRSSKKI